MKLISFVLLILSFDVFACDCILKDIKDEYALSSIVFIGTAQKIEIVENTMNAWPGYSSLKKISFVVDKSYKGINNSKTSIFTGLDEGGCGYSFENNVKYIVFGLIENSNIHVNMCSLTVNAEPASNHFENNRKSVLEFLSDQTGT